MVRGRDDRVLPRRRAGWVRIAGSLGVVAIATFAAFVFAAVEPASDEAPSPAEVLDAFHLAASRADVEAYFDRLAPDAVFLGTAPGERWTRSEFLAFVEPYFSAGRGWTYVPREGARHVVVDRAAGVAWFDEVLDNEKYGRCRGTGILRRADGRWRIEHYNLMIPIPNEVTPDVVERIRGTRAP